MKGGVIAREENSFDNNCVIIALGHFGSMAEHTLTHTYIHTYMHTHTHKDTPPCFTLLMNAQDEEDEWRDLIVSVLNVCCR